MRVLQVAVCILVLTTTLYTERFLIQSNSPSGPLAAIYKRKVPFSFQVRGGVHH